MPPLLALGVAFFIALVELLTSQYPRTTSFCIPSWALFWYGAIYGAIGLGIALGLGSLREAEILTLDGLGVDNPWVLSFVVGLVVKSLLHLRIISIGTSAGTFPIGIETIVQVFEPWLLRTIELDHFNNLRSYVEPRALRHNNLVHVNQLIKNGVPKSFSEYEKVAFQADVDKATTIVEVMELYIGFVGKRSFNRIFPA